MNEDKQESVRSRVEVLLSCMTGVIQSHQRGVGSVQGEQHFQSDEGVQRCHQGGDSLLSLFDITITNYY